MSLRLSRMVQPTPRVWMRGTGWCRSMAVRRTVDGIGRCSRRLPYPTTFFCSPCGVASGRSSRPSPRWVQGQIPMAYRSTQMPKTASKASHLAGCGLDRS